MCGGRARAWLGASAFPSVHRVSSPRGLALCAVALATSRHWLEAGPSQETRGDLCLSVPVLASWVGEPRAHLSCSHAAPGGGPGSAAFQGVLSHPDHWFLPLQTGAS